VVLAANFFVLLGAAEPVSLMVLGDVGRPLHHLHFSGDPHQSQNHLRFLERHRVVSKIHHLIHYPFCSFEI
jgi:hypothetical protein